MSESELSVKFRLEQVFIGSRKLVYAGEKAKVEFHTKDVGLLKIPLPLQMRQNNEKHNTIGLPLSTLSIVHFYSTPRNNRGNNANIGYFVLQPKEIGFLFL